LLNGLLRVTAGTLNGGFSRGLGSLGGGSFWQEGGTVNAWQFRPKSTGTGIFSYKQTGGTFNVGYGFALSGGKIDQFEVQYARFDLSNTNCSFEMSGSAILNIAKPTSNQTTPRIGGLFSVAAGSGNYSVTGGTVNLYTGDKSTNGLTYVGRINSTVPLYDVNIFVDNVAVTPLPVQLQTNDLTVLNNLTINGTNTPTFNCNDKNLTIGGNFSINNGAVFTSAGGTLTGTLTQASENYSNLNNATNTNISPSSTTGSGTGALFTIVITANNVSSITITNPGTGYQAGDQVTFDASLLSGTGGRTGSAVYNIAAANIVATPTNTITFNGSGAQTWAYGSAAAGAAPIISSLNAVVVNKSAGALSLSFPRTGTTALPNIPTLTLTSGTFNDGGSVVTVTGTLTNNATHTTTIASGNITFSGTNAIGGNNGTFGNLVISANNSVSTSGTQAVTGDLRLTSANSTLNIGSNALTVLGGIYDAATGTTVVFTNTKRILTSGIQNAGGLTRKGAAGDILFPVGSAAFGGNPVVPYTPVTINVTASTHGNITVRPVNSEHPNVTTQGESLKYYWNVTSSGYSGITGVLHKTYNFSTAVQSTLTGSLTGNLTPNTSTVTGMTAGTYTNVSATSGGTGTGARFTVVVGSATSITSVTVASGGSGYTGGTDVLTFSGALFGAGSNSATFNVTAANISASTTANYVAARYDRTLNNWSKNNTPQSMTGNIIQPNPFNTGTGWTLGSGVVGDQLDGEYTCGISGAFGSFLTTFYSRASANWNVNSTWSTVAVGGVAATSNPTSCPTCPVIIGDGSVANGHTVTCVAASSCGSLTISTNATLDCSTFTGHNFGTSTGGVVSGNGKLRIATTGTAATNMFPAGDFTNFLGPNGGTVEWYGATKTIPTTGPTPQNLSLATYYNLILNPSSANTITMPASNLTVYNDLTQGSTATYNGIVFTPSASTTLTITDSLSVKNGTWTFSNLGAYPTSISVGGTKVWSGATMRVATGGTSNANSLTTTGGIKNNGTITFSNGGTVAVTFTGTTDAAFSGSGATVLSRMTINKGSSSTPTLTFSLSGTLTTTAAAAGWLTLSNGTFDYEYTGASLTYPTVGFTIGSLSTSSYTIPTTSKLKVGAGIIAITNASGGTNDLFLNGTLEVARLDATHTGTVYTRTTAANGSDNDIEYSSAGTPSIIVSDGSLLVDGSIRRSTSTITGVLVYNQTGGAVTVGGNASSNTRGVFEIDANTGSSFTMTNSSSLTVQRQTGGTSYADLYINPITSTVDKTSTINVGLSSLTTNTNFRVNVVPTIGNFTVVGTNAQTVNLYNDLAASGTLTITSPSSLLTTQPSPDADVTIGGDFICTGTYNTSGVNTTTFNGSGAQAAGLTSNTQFYNATINKPAGTVTVFGTAPAAPGLNNLNILSGKLRLGNSTDSTLNNTLKVNRNIIINGSQTGTQAVEVYSTSGISNTITSSGGTFTNLILGGTVANTTVSVSGNLAINGTLNLLNGANGATNRYLDIGSSQLTFGAAAPSPTNPGSAAFIRTNGVASDLGVVKNWTSAGSFVYAVGTSTNYTPATFTTSSATTGTITVVPVNSVHNTATPKGSNGLGTDYILNYYWTVTRSSSLVATLSGNFTFQCPSSLRSGSAGTFVPGYLDPNALNSNGGWVTNVGSAGIASGTITLTFPSTPTTDFPSASPYYYDYSAGTSIGTPATLPNPIKGVYSKTGAGKPPVGVGGGNWTTGSNWTYLSDGDLANSGTGDYSNAFYTYPYGLPVTISPGTQINMDVDGLIAYSTTIKGTLYNASTAGHNLGTISGTGTFRTATGTFPAGTYTSFVAATGGGTIEYSGTTTMNSLATYNNLVISNKTINNTNGASPSTVTMTASNITVNGTLTISASGLGSPNVLDDSQTSSHGDISIAKDFTNNGTFLEGTSNVSITGNLTNSGTFNDGSGTVNLSGNFSNTGTFSGGNGTVSFNGTAAQTITGATTFNNLTINNSFATAPQVTIASGSQTVGSTFKSTKGLLNLNSTTLTIGTACASPGAVSHSTLSSAGWVYGGSLTRYFNTTAISDGSLTGFFPIGTSVNFRPFAISVPTGNMSTCGTFTLSAGSSTASNVVSILDPTNTTSPIVVQYQGAWTVSSSGVTGGTYNVTAGGSGFGVIGSLSDVTLSKGTTTVGTYVLATANTTADPRMERTGLSLTDITTTDGNKFFVGSTNPSSSPLPIELLSFNGESKNYGVDLQWKTASEMNNDYFTVSRSATGANFESIGTVKGNGTTSSMHTYSLIDYKPILGKNYYQLKQTDFDNNVTTSETIVVNVLSLEPLISIYPNPLSQNQLLNVVINGLEVNTPTEIQIVNVQGTAVRNANANTDSDGSLKTSLDLTGLSAGLYILKIQNVHYKFVIE
jgi:hypothetical protein